MLPGQAVKTGPWLSATVTVKLHELLLPDVSEAEQVTVVTPFGNALPAAGEQVTTAAPSQASVAVGAVYVTAAVHNPASVLAVMFVGHPAKVGPWLSLTVTVKLHVEFGLTPFVAVQVTVVVPFANALPDGGEHVTVGEGQPVAVGVANVTAAVQSPGSVLVVMLVGQAPIVGASRTVVVAGLVATVEKFDPETEPWFVTVQTFGGNGVSIVTENVIVTTLPGGITAMALVTVSPDIAEALPVP
jgi:hypothetical protein